MIIDCTITERRPLRAAITGDAMSCNSGMIVMTRGESAALDLFFTTTNDDDEEEAIDLTGASIYFQVKPRVASATAPLIAKEVAAGIVIEDQLVEATLGHATLSILTTDTDDVMDPGLYAFEVRIVEASGNNKSASAGTFQLKGEVVNLPVAP